MKKIFIIIMSVMFIVTGCSEKNNNNDIVMTDADKFSAEYVKVDKENPFVYRTLEEANAILENGTGIVYLGFPECPWCQQYVVYLNEVAKDYEIEKIYYVNIFNDRNNNTEEYKKTVSLLEGYLQYDEEGKRRIYVPAVIAINKGEIVGFDDESAWDTKGYDSPEKYWNVNRVESLKLRLEQMILDTNLNACTECNK